MSHFRAVMHSTAGGAKPGVGAGRSTGRGGVACMVRDVELVGGRERSQWLNRIGGSSSQRRMICGRLPTASISFPSLR